MNTLFPPRLRRGDVIGLVSPASPVEDPSKIDRAVRYLEKSGYQVELGAHVAQPFGYLAARDSERSADIHAMFSDPRVKAIIALRGGYGSPRLLPLLDYGLIAANPKVFVGFSDITALQLAFWARCRLVTFHGPMAAVDWGGEIDPFTEEAFWKAVCSTELPEPLTFAADATTKHHGGKAEGTLLGGNLSLLISTLGTPYQPDFSDSVLFFEDVDEEPYRIDRMLVQLRNMSIVERSAAVLAGQFSRCVPRRPGAASLSVTQILDDLVTPAAKPFLSGLPIGHVKAKLTLPVGVRARLDADNCRLTFLEAAVS